MDLSTSIDAAYQQAEDTENTALQIEARIVAFGGRPLLRQYGKPVDATAIKQNLTLVSQLNRFDPKLATYLGVQSGYQQQLELEQAARKAASEAMQAATAALKERNDANANNRYRHSLQGTNPATGARYI
jgi:bacterioferritin (cytochrome b1)